MKLFVYENYEGDRGVIIADTAEKAATIFHDEYPDRKIVDTDEEWRKGNSFLREFGAVENNKLFNILPW